MSEHKSNSSIELQTLDPQLPRSDDTQLPIINQHRSCCTKFYIRISMTILAMAVGLTLFLAVLAYNDSYYQKWDYSVCDNKINCASYRETWFKEQKVTYYNKMCAIIKNKTLYSKHSVDNTTNNTIMWYLAVAFCILIILKITRTKLGAWIMSCF